MHVWFVELIISCSFIQVSINLSNVERVEFYDDDDDATIEIIMCMYDDDCLFFIASCIQVKSNVCMYGE